MNFINYVLTSLFLITSTVIAQTNKFYNAGENWSYLYVTTSGPQPTGIIASYTYVEGDTIVDSKIFKKVFNLYKEWLPSNISPYPNPNSFSPYFGSTTEPVGFVREENDTMFFYSPTPNDLVFFVRVINDSYYVYNNDVFYSYNVTHSYYINGVQRRHMGSIVEGTIRINIYDPIYSNPDMDTGGPDHYYYFYCYGGNDSLYYYHKGEDVIYDIARPITDSVIYGNCNLDDIYYSALESYGLLPHVEIWPNPVTDILNIHVYQNNHSLAYKIFSINGKLMWNGELNDEKTNLDLSRLSSGIYFIQIMGENMFSTYRFVKQ